MTGGIVTKQSSVLTARVLGTLCLAQLAAVASAATSGGASEASGLSEVVVTAEKVKSTVQEVPISVTALDAAQLTQAGLVNIEDITRDVPGLSMRYAGPGLAEYEARGLASNGGAAPTVGFYLDEIPLSPPALSQSGKVIIDPSLYDIARVEILRGPQGTLYGSGSMGGTVKVITNPPKLGTFEASVQGTVSDTEGGSLNGGGSGMINLPLGDVLAFRVVGSDQYRSGWIDNITVRPFPVTLGNPVQGNVLAAPVVSEFHHANTMKLTGVRAALLFQPNSDISITVTAMGQHMALGGYDLLDGSPSGPDPSRVYNAHYEAFSLREPIHDDIAIYGLTAIFNLGFADLTSATSYWDRLNWQTQDSSESLYWTNGAPCAAVGTAPCVVNGGLVGTPFVPVGYSEKDPSHQISEEVRLTSHDTGPLHWVAGAFYSSLRSVWVELSSSPAVAALYPSIPSGSYFTSYNPYTVKQTALFADGSYKLTDTLKIAAGVRWYTYKSQQDEFSWGYDGPFPAPPPAPAVTRFSDKGYNPRVNFSWEPDKDLNTYITASRGFRPGGANQLLPPPNQPPFCSKGSLTFDSDHVWNYEIGEKARMLNGWLTVNSDFYYIKWYGVQQVFTLPCGYQYYNNAGNGRSYGPELEINAKLASEWTLSLSGAYTDAKITEPNASYHAFLSSLVTNPNGVTHPCPAVGRCVVPIMNVPRDTASVSLVYETLLPGDYTFSGRISDSFVGETSDVAYYFGYNLPSYNISNLRFNLSHERWMASLFVDNLGNKQALLSANNTSFQFNIPQVVRYSTNQPRTYGLEFNYHF
jgi:iron complex outermembrane recepter protein